MKRILFVDDESRVLDGLRRSLHDKRKVWELTFATSGPAALEQVAKTPFDVIVSDMRMPGMDGAQFLQRVAALRPEAGRIVLSGQMEESVATRAAAVAHRFLTKPCDPLTLKSAVERTLELQEMLRSDELKRCISGMVALPSLPSACAALDRAISDETNSIGDICAVIREDVGMAANALKLVNSAFFGLSRNVTDIEQAVHFLGLNTIRNLVLAHSLFQAFEGGETGDTVGLLEHSLFASRVARKLFDDTRSAEVAATGALLHDAGALALASQLPGPHGENVKAARERRLPLQDVERERFGVTHAQIGAYLLGLWGVPHDVLDAVAAHHDPLPPEGPLTVSTGVRVALAVTEEFMDGIEVGDKDSELSPDLVAKLGLGPRLAGIMTELRAPPRSEAFR